jgi:hypothetical protein
MHSYFLEVLEAEQGACAFLIGQLHGYHMHSYFLEVLEAEQGACAFLIGPRVISQSIIKGKERLLLWLVLCMSGLIKALTLF